MYLKTILTLVIATMLTLTYAQSNQDVLMTVGDQDVTVGEFKYIYEKNNGKSADYSKESLDEYLELYKKFKLKVAKAKDMQLDTIESLNLELQGYRNQLANSFLTDREVIDRLITEIYERQKQDIRISHILVKTNSRSTFKEQEQARKKLLNIKQQLKEGRSFSDLANDYSEDKNSKSNGGDLGYITSNLPDGFYELENAAYNLGVAEVSDPIKTKLGYHLVKVTDKRHARGTVKVAHIFMKTDAKSRAGVEKVKKTMDSLYVALNNGADFSDLAMKFSQDPTTSKKAGILPAFGIGIYDHKFEDAAFALENDGDFTRPILTSAGYHIIKLIEKPAPPKLSDLKIALKDKLVKYDRYTMAMDDMLTRIKNEAEFTENEAVFQDFVNSLDETFYSYRWKPAPDLGGDVIFSFGPKDKETIMSFAIFAKKNTRLRSQFDKSYPLEDAAKLIYEEFLKEKAFEYEQATLEEKYPEFKSLMREYEEGILLFEATKINVWDKANQDTVGLYTFYENNKSNYMFEDQALLGKYIVNTTDEKVLKKVMKCAKKRDIEKTKKNFKKYGEDFIEYSEFKVEPGSKELAGLKFKKKSISEPIIDKNNGKSSFKKVVDIEPSRRKTLNEARGYVIADYQDELEKKWIKQLKKEYPIEVNQEVYQSLMQ